MNPEPVNLEPIKTTQLPGLLTSETSLCRLWLGLSDLSVAVRARHRHRPPSVDRIHTVVRGIGGEMRPMRALIGKLSVVITVAAAAATLGLRAQAPAKADAEYLRKAYDTYRTMVQASPYRTVPWQYLGPTNISGRATDIAVAERPSGRRIYAAYAV